jgi:hypothetical protein
MRWDYIIPECNIEELNRLIDKANKQASKLGLSPITVAEKEIEHRDFLVREKNSSNTSHWIHENNFDESKHENLGSVRNWMVVSVQGDTPKFAGWTFCATLMPVPTDKGAENQIRKVPGVEIDIPKEYRDRVGECDHCNKNRRRNETYIVNHEDGTFKMVGSSCIKDFLGHADPHAIAEYLSRIHDFSMICGVADDEGEFWGSHKEPDAYNALSILKLTSAVISQYGWMSKKQVWNDGYGVATATRVQTCLLPLYRLSADEKKIVDKCKVIQRDVELADEVFAWMGEIDPNVDNEYLYNLSLLSRSEYINSKSLGLLCSAVSSYDRELAKKEKTKEFADSKHVGEVKERREFNVTVKRIFEKDGDFGLTRIHHMLTDNNEYLVWFASSRGLEEGQSYTVKATIKKHDEFRGVKQTVVNRVTPITEKVLEDAK